MREYEYREFEFERAKRETEILQNEKKTLQLKLNRREQDSERLKHALTSRIAELEARVDSSDDYSPGVHSPMQAQSQDTQMLIQRAVADSQQKLTQLKKAHSRLLEKFTDLELEYQSVKSQLDAMQGHGHADNEGPTCAREELLQEIEVARRVIVDVAHRARHRARVTTCDLRCKRSHRRAL